MNRFIRTVALALAAIVSTGVASNADARPVGMPTTGITSQPIGHYEFCKRYPGQCGAEKRTAPLRLSKATWDKIVEVNSAVNTSIYPREDMAIYGKADVWAYPSAEGDCEDFALLKQYMLERAGIPASTLLLTVVLQSNGEGHAVLTVRTDRGDFVLDNLERRVSLWSETDYTYLKRQADDNAGRWVGITDDRSVLVGSLR